MTRSTHRTRTAATTLAALSTAAVAVFSLAACGSGSSSGSASTASTASDAADGCTVVEEDAAWYGDNRDRLNAMINDLGDCGRSPDADGAPLALFDWDNTVVKNDIGEAQTFWMLANGKVLQPRDRDWTTVSPYLTPEAAGILATSCGDLADPGDPLPTDTPQGADCADNIAAIHSDATTTDGTEAFHSFNARRMEPAYAFDGQLLAGYTDDEIRDFARRARDQNLGADEGTEQKVGSGEGTGWVRYYSQIGNLFDALRDHGFDVRIISASSKPVAEVWGESVGFTPDKVMGLQMEEKDGRWGTTPVTCGGEADTMPYIEGKRCRINEDVLGISGSAAFDPAPADKRQVFAAGDSDTDVTFLSDATALRLILNRDKTELMCRAYDDADGKWLVNPMFIDPEPRQEDPYPCSTEGRIEPDGSSAPLPGEGGKPVPDQEDRVSA
jgi:phosphoserine phosphatase